MSAVDLGTGILSWPRSERVSDRYGAVFLLARAPEDYFIDDPGFATDFASAPAGKVGRLRAEVVAQGRSGHIGDLFRGLHPPEEPPAVGSVHVLGEGTLFREQSDGDDWTVGLEPRESRASDWLDPRVLYTLHEQTVRLYFEVVR